MSGHADTIRRALNRASSLAVTGTPTFAAYREAGAALDALVAENQRLAEEIRVREQSQIPVIPRGAQQKMERLEAENQRYDQTVAALVDVVQKWERSYRTVAAESQRLRDALERVKWNAESWHGADPDGIDHAHHGQQKALNVISEWCGAASDGTP